MATITVNGERREVLSPSRKPLLYILRNELDIGSPQFGCGMAQCGSCSALLDGMEIRACVTPLSAAADKEVTFDESTVTVSDWISYPILKMADMPEVEVILVNRPDIKIYGQG